MMSWGIASLAKNTVHSWGSAPKITIKTALHNRNYGEPFTLELRNSGEPVGYTVCLIY